MIKKCTNHQSLDLANVELMNQNHLPLKKNKHVSNKKSKNSWGFKLFWFAKFQKTKSFYKFNKNQQIFEDGQISWTFDPLPLSL